MKKVLVFLFSVSLFGLCSNSGIKSCDGLLWKISGNGLVQPSYLFGTHHFFDASFLDSVPGFAGAFASVDQVVGELDMSDSAVFKESAGALALKGMMPADTTYAMLLDSADLVCLDGFLEKQMHVNSSKIKIKPVMLDIMLGTVCSKMAFPPDPLDTYIMKTAAGDKKTIVGLETVEEQVNVLLPPSCSLTEQARTLMSHVKNIDEVVRLTYELNAAYRRQSLSDLEKIFRGDDLIPELQFTKEQENALLKTRNDNWMEKLPALIGARPSLIAVGAGHLVGEYGLIAQLRRAGYTVEPVH